MKLQLIKTIDLENSMQLNIFDGSRKLAGDRCLVTMVARIEIPLSEELMKDEGKRQEMKTSCRAIAKKQAGLKVAEKLIEISG